MRNPGGYFCLTDPEKGTTEGDSFTCRHCCRLTFVKPKMSPTDLGGLCRVCDGLICSQCVGKGCDPLEEQLRRMENRDIALRSYGV